MIVTKTKRKKNSYISYKREKSFRDSLIVLGKGRGHVVFKTTFNNIYVMYEAISIPLSNGIYKVKITSVDNYDNENTGTEGNAVLAFYPLPPKNLSGTVSGSNVTLTWSHSINGAPDNYLVYGNGGSGNVIDRSIPLYVLAGSLLTYTFAIGNGQWKFVIESRDNGQDSKSLIFLPLSVPSASIVPPSPGPSNGDTTLPPMTGLILENVSIGKVKVQFYWPHGNKASKFRVYHDNGTGTISYASYAYEFTRQNSLIQTYTTTQLIFTNTLTTFKFVIRAVTIDNVEDLNTDEYSIVVDGLAPDNVDTLILDSIF
jgi:hypothetical protein